MSSPSAYILSGLVILGFGIWQLLMPLDQLWRWQETRSLRRGLAPQRNALWEGNVRVGAWVCVALGVFLLFIPMFSSAGAGSTASAPKMSGASINGHEFTEQEWDACGHDFNVCASLAQQRGEKF